MTTAIAVREASLDLAGGRRVDYCEIGEPDASPVLYCHGTPGSRLEPLLARTALERRGVPIRIIAPSRPGYGRSDLAAHRGFLPWAEDASEILDRLGVDTFAVLGASGGSPYAFACAGALADRIDRVGIVAGVAPPETAGMEDAAAIAEEYASGTIRAVRYGALSLAVRMGLADRLARRLVRALGPADRRAMDVEDALSVFGRIVFDAFAQRGRAVTHEAGLLMRPWDVDPTLLPQVIRLWHGAQDTQVPVRAATELVESLANASCVVWPQHGHFSWAAGDEAADVARWLTDGAA